LFPGFHQRFFEAISDYAAGGIDSFRERNEIESFLKEAVAAGEHCLGRCLYISGVPGTGKVGGLECLSLTDARSNLMMGSISE
jgi:hypothetical protein